MHPLEERILRLYAKHGIFSPYQISLHVYDSILPIHVVYRYGPPLTVDAENNPHVFVDGHLSLPERRVVIAHEIGHILLHAGIQTWMAPEDRSKQEWQANRFAAYALAPTPMMQQALHEEECYGALVGGLAEVFGVTGQFMVDRLALLEQDMASNMVCVSI